MKISITDFLTFTKEIHDGNFHFLFLLERWYTGSSSDSLTCLREILQTINFSRKFWILQWKMIQFRSISSDVNLKINALINFWSIFHQIYRLYVDLRVGAVYLYIWKTLAQRAIYQSEPFINLLHQNVFKLINTILY